MWFVLLSVVLALAIYKFLKYLRLWDDRKVVSLGSWQLVCGMCAGLFRTQALGNFILKIYSDFPKHRYFGTFVFDRPVLVIRDPDLLKQITVKDFDNFENHRQIISEEAEPLWGKNLFSLQGQKWRDMRATLSPAFTSAKMKSMFVLISECADQFTQHFYNKKEDIITLEMKDTFTRFTNDVIASTAFGIKCDSLGERNNEFYLMGKEVTDFSGMKFVKIILLMSFPILGKVFKSSIFSTEVSTFFRKLVKEKMEQREREGIIRPDMIHLLMEAQKGRLNHEESTQGINNAGFATVEESNVGKAQSNQQKGLLSDDDVTAQALLFFFAGFDSVATLMCFMSYELAVNPEIQARLQAEVDDTFQECEGILTYEALSKMKYLDMVVSETLRKWPASPAVDRICNKNYTIPAKRSHEEAVEVREGDLIWIPILGIQRDAEHFPDPDKFDPERFNDDNKHTIKHLSYIPFGAGPRNCIGCRFALLESKAVIFHLLTKFNIVVIKKTVIPLVLNKKVFTMASENGMWLGLKKRPMI